MHCLLARGEPSWPSIVVITSLLLGRAYAYRSGPGGRLGFRKQRTEAFGKTVNLVRDLTSQLSLAGAPVLAYAVQSFLDNFSPIPEPFPGSCWAQSCKHTGSCSLSTFHWSIFASNTRLWSQEQHFTAVRKPMALCRTVCLLVLAALACAEGRKILGTPARKLMCWFHCLKVPCNPLPGSGGVYCKIYGHESTPGQRRPSSLACRQLWSGLAACLTAQGCICSESIATVSHQSESLTLAWLQVMLFLPHTW